MTGARKSVSLLLCLFTACFVRVDAQQDAAVPTPEFRASADTPPPAGATITFKFEDPRQQPAKFQITIHSDGSGHFVSQVGSAPPDDIANLPAQGQERDIKLADATRDRLFSIATKEKYFATKCDSGATKVAYQGTKTLVYEGPDGRGACTYNYSQDAKVQWITTQLMGLATTLEEGRRLKVQHEHARLVLDAELETLASLVHDGQATEVQTIEPVLSAIIADDNVMLRARRRAQALLDNDGVPSAK
jgi:hypothetical protein